MTLPQCSPVRALAVLPKLQKTPVGSGKGRSAHSEGRAGVNCLKNLTVQKCMGPREIFPQVLWELASKVTKALSAIFEKSGNLVKILET